MPETAKLVCTDSLLDDLLERDSENKNQASLLAGYFDFEHLTRNPYLYVADMLGVGASSSSVAMAQFE